MNKQKQLWEKLAKQNSKYVIASHKGKGITDLEFQQSGHKDYKDLIYFDDLMNKRDNILEIGCGNGRMTEFMAIAYQKVIATDISGEMIKQGKERLKQYKNIKWLETDGYNIPLSDSLIDFAFSYLVFQHFKTQEMIESNFKEVYRILKPEGLFKVLVRTDKVNIDSTWWGGVDCDESIPVKYGFKVIKKEKVSNYGLWLWLIK